MGFHINDVEKGMLSRLAEKEGGLSRAALLRRLIHREARNLGVTVDLEISKTQQCKLAQ